MSETLSNQRRLLPIVLALAASSAVAAPCASDDFTARVGGVDACLLVKPFGATGPATAGTMLVWLHGDVSSGGPATYHFAPAQQAAADLGADRVLSVAVVRPGYPGDDGQASTGDLSGRADHYTRRNVEEVAAVVRRLKAHYRPDRMILVGHSGGAATAAILLGLDPALAQGAVLAACPCELGAWRAGRRAWSRSENPLRWADRVSPQATVLALTGADDDNTSPELARTYVRALAERGVKAEFQLVPGATHNGVFRSQALRDAVKRLVEGQ